MVKVVTYLLENNSTVQALLGDKSHGDGHKVYPIIIASGEVAPFIAVGQTDRLRLGHDLSCGTEYTIFVNAYSKSYDDLDALCDAVIDALEGQSGTINTVSVGSVVYDNQTDLAFDKELEVYGRSTTFKVTI